MVYKPCLVPWLEDGDATTCHVHHALDLCGYIPRLQALQDGLEFGVDIVLNSRKEKVKRALLHLGLQNLLSHPG